MDDLHKKLKDIKIILFDLEGVLLNDYENHDEETLRKIGESFKSFCEKVKKYNLKGGIVTASNIKIHLKQFMKIPDSEILTSSIDKVSNVRKLMSKLGIEFRNIFYIGDDILDIPLLMKVGVSAAPKNSRREVKRIVDYISPAHGGEKLLEDVQN